MLMQENFELIFPECFAARGLKGTPHRKNKEFPPKMARNNWAVSFLKWRASELRFDVVWWLRRHLGYCKDFSWKWRLMTEHRPEGGPEQ